MYHKNFLFAGQPKVALPMFRNNIASSLILGTKETDDLSLPSYRNKKDYEIEENIFAIQNFALISSLSVSSFYAYPLFFWLPICTIALEH